MKSIKYKLMLPIIALALLLILIICVQVITIKNNLQMVTEMKDKSFTTMSKSEDLKLDVVQVQQWLTDISATRAAVGFNDGFNEAEKHAQNVKTILNELTKLNPEQKEALDNIKNHFEPYYETGKRMAKAYIDGGPDKGNQIMGEFDKTAEKINSEVDLFKNNSRKNIESTIVNIRQSTQNIILILIISIFALIAALVIVWISITKVIIQPIKLLGKELNLLAGKGGDLTQHIDVRTNDEIGELSLSFNKFIANLRSIIIEVNKCSDSVEGAAINVTKCLTELNLNIEHVSNCSAAIRRNGRNSCSSRASKFFVYRN